MPDDEVTALRGELPGGAAYRIWKPAGWNGTLMLFCSGYAHDLDAAPTTGVDPVVGDWLLANGYALAKASYSSAPFWALEYALPENRLLAAEFARLCGPPQRTIVWGPSQGGAIAAGLLQRYPDAVSAAMPMCGALSGAVAVRNQNLDCAFVFKTLLAPRSDLELVDIADPEANVLRAVAVLDKAQTSAAGRARVALAAAVGQIPGWFDESQPEPLPDDVGSRQANQARWLREVCFAIFFGARSALEARAGGNPSWNDGVDYAVQLERSAGAGQVRALYAAAGLDLDGDLDVLARSPRVSADPGAVEYLTRNIVFDGDLHGRPVLTIHTTGDGLVTVDNESAYRETVEAAGHAGDLRQLVVDRAGHCAFSRAELIVAIQALMEREATGDWPPLEAAALNRAAAGLGPSSNVLASGIAADPAFVDDSPPAFLRPGAVAS